MSIFDLMGEIFSLAHQVSEDNKTDVFVSYSGHVEFVRVRIYNSGFMRADILDLAPDLDLSIWLKSPDAKESLEQVKSYLQEIGGFLEV